MNFSYGYGLESEEGFLAVILYYVVYAVLGGGFGIALYVLRSLGVYGIAKRRGLNHAWFAWVPVVNGYLLGCVSDQYRYVVKGQNKSKRKWLLGLHILSAILTLVLVGSILGLVVQMGTMAMHGVGEAKLANAAMSSAMKIMALSLPLTLVSIAAAVVRFMALYDLYTSCDPRNNVLYLVLSIFFQVTEPFFIFFNRNRDDGMPPRKADPVYNEPAQEPPIWEEYQTGETE